MNLPQEGKVVNLVVPAVYSSSSVSAAYVSMENYGHVDFVIQFGSCSSLASDVVTMKQAKSTSGSSSSSLAVNGYYHNRSALGSSSTNNDTLTKVSYSSMSSSGKKFKLASNSVSNQLYVIPVDADMLNVDSGLKAAGITISTLGKAALAIQAVLSEPRYAAESPPSAL